MRCDFFYLHNCKTGSRETGIGNLFVLFCFVFYIIFLSEDCISCLISFNLRFASFKIAHKWLSWLQRAIFLEQNMVSHIQSAMRMAKHSQWGSTNRGFNMHLSIVGLPKWHFSKLTAICQSAIGWTNRGPGFVLSLYADGGWKPVETLGRGDWLNPNPGIYRQSPPVTIVLSENKTNI